MAKNIRARGIWAKYDKLKDFLAPKDHREIPKVCQQKKCAVGDTYEIIGNNATINSNPFPPGKYIDGNDFMKSSSLNSTHASILSHTVSDIRTFYFELI